MSPPQVLLGLTMVFAVADLPPFLDPAVAPLLGPLLLLIAVVPRLPTVVTFTLLSGGPRVILPAPPLFGSRVPPALAPNVAASTSRDGSVIIYSR
jgi:hypothetical protein